MKILETTSTRLAIKRERKNSTLIFHTVWLASGLLCGICWVLSINPYIPLVASIAGGLGYVSYLLLLLFLLPLPFALTSLSFPPPTTYIFDKTEKLLIVCSESNFLLGWHRSRKYALLEILPPQWRTDSKYVGSAGIIHYQTLILPRGRLWDEKRSQIHIHSFGSAEDDRIAIGLITQFLQSLSTVNANS